MKMPRIRKRAALFLCAVCMLLFLSFYFIINNAAPAADKKSNYGIIENKLRRLETGLRENKQEMLTLKHQLINKKEKWNTDKANAAAQAANESIYKECDFDMKQVPTVDVQMLEVYNKVSFQDVDGGAWKQGWNIKYDALQYNSHHKLKVFVVPHSHNDPGWTKTFEEYYEHDTKHILSNGLRHLRENPDMKFIWAEISYFSRFYQDLGQHNKQELKRLISNHQLEFVTGGWVMPDEANSHWLSVLMQLTEGQTWLKKYLNVTPTSSWAIDPFGHSPTLPYVLKLSGFDNLLIQRTHYIVKKELALKKHLEFHWRQIWDNSGYFDLFTHMMPFYSYDIPHTCGPDPKICCQFDFKRLPGFGLNCPWHVPPKSINEHNVAERAELLTDQWKKKAQLYRTNALLIPLGDDFRYSQSTEWDVQRINFEQLFEHINNNAKYAVEAKFGTLQEYFDALRNEEKQDFPILSGDFFTYADRTDNYWSGYYTSRPYHKRMDRVLLHYVRAAEMLHAWCSWQAHAKFDVMLQEARRQLSLFQHHDGITGTARTHVVLDYEWRMVEALKASKFVMQQSIYQLLTKPSIYSADYKFEYFHLDDSRWPGGNNERSTIILGEELPNKYVVFHNSLPHWREELIDLYVSSPFMKVSDFAGRPVQAQISPVWTWHRHTLSKTVTPQASATKYRLAFKVKVPPLGLSNYVISITSENAEDTVHTDFASSLILTGKPISISMGDYPKNVQFAKNREFSLHVGNGPTVAFSADGLMKSIQLPGNAEPMPVHLKFYKYAPRISGEFSGAYLFLPNGPATPFVDMEVPAVLVVEGALESSVSVGLPFMVHETLLRIDEAPEIRNLVDIGEMDDTEIVMRFSTHIKNGDVFYTDLNGLQIIKRRHFSKLPLQANYYPIPTSIYIDDGSMRLTVVSAQPLGGTSLAQGEIEIMQDRRLTHDDERGVGQGVLDNQPVLHIFRILLENVKVCQQPNEQHPAGALTLAAHAASKTLLHPIDKLIYAENDWPGVQANFGAEHAEASVDIEVAVMRSLEPTNAVNAVARARKSKLLRNLGIVLHRTKIMHCRNDGYVDASAKLTLQNLLQLGQNVTAAYSSTITFLKQLQSIDIKHPLALCPMDTKAFIIRQK